MNGFPTCIFIMVYTRFVFCIFQNYMLRKLYNVNYILLVGMNTSIIWIEICRHGICIYHWKFWHDPRTCTKIKVNIKPYQTNSKMQTTISLNDGKRKCCIHIICSKVLGIEREFRLNKRPKSILAFT